MEKEKKALADMATALWQGKAIDLECLTSTIDGVMNEMMEGVSRMQQRGISFPMEYVMDAMRHISESITSRDDYRLADCIYYEWLEIIGVYEEVMAELG